MSECELIEEADRWISERGDFNSEYTAGLIRRLAAALRDRADEGGWRTPADRPTSGRRIIAPFHDGSGAILYFVHDDGFIDSDGDDIYHEHFDDQHTVWAYLPDAVTLWCENRSEDPMIFPKPPHPEPEGEAGR